MHPRPGQHDCGGDDQEVEERPGLVAGSRVVENHGCVAAREMSAVGGEQVRIAQGVNIGNSVSENNDRVLDSVVVSTIDSSNDTQGEVGKQRVAFVKFKN